MSKYGVISDLNTVKYGPEKTPYLDIFHAVSGAVKNDLWFQKWHKKFGEFSTQVVESNVR